MTNDRLSYFTVIEQHSQGARGTPSFRLTPVGFNLIDKWEKSGIPVEAVLRGIDRTFDNWRKSRRRAHNEMINSVAYCRHAIAVEAQTLANATGKRAGPSAPPCVIEAISKHVTGNASLLRKAAIRIWLFRLKQLMWSNARIEAHLISAIATPIYLAQV